MRRLRRAQKRSNGRNTLHNTHHLQGTQAFYCSTTLTSLFHDGFDKGITENMTIARNLPSCMSQQQLTTALETQNPDNSALGHPHHGLLHSPRS